MANLFASTNAANGAFAILKNWYAGPIVSQFNDEIPFYREIEKGKEKFNGSQVVRKELTESLGYKDGNAPREVTQVIDQLIDKLNKDLEGKPGGLKTAVELGTANVIMAEPFKSAQRVKAECLGCAVGNKAVDGRQQVGPCGDRRGGDGRDAASAVQREVSGLSWCHQYSGIRCVGESGGFAPPFHRRYDDDRGDILLRFGGHRQCHARRRRGPRGNT